jgi:hypothetical protein
MKTLYVSDGLVDSIDGEGEAYSSVCSLFGSHLMAMNASDADLTK